MNEHAHGGESLGVPLGAGPLDEAVVPPIEPDHPGGAAKALAKLVIADPERDEIKSGVVAQVYAAIQKLDRPDAGVNELNNIGCAWALLAYNEARLEYWSRARKSLDSSRKHKDATEAQKKRVKENLDHISEARKAMETR